MGVPPHAHSELPLWYMSLIQCKECESKISTKAEKCPHCGAPNRAKTSGCAWLLLFGVILIVVLGVASSLDSWSSGELTSTSPKPTAADKARAIIGGDNEVLASTHKGFLKIDRVLTEDYSEREVAQQTADLMLSAAVVNKLSTAMSETELIRIYQEWCEQMNKTSATLFPKFITACQNDEVKEMSDGVIDYLTR